MIGSVIAQCVIAYCLYQHYKLQTQLYKANNEPTGVEYTDELDYTSAESDELLQEWAKQYAPYTKNSLYIPPYEYVQKLVNDDDDSVEVITDRDEKRRGL